MKAILISIKPQWVAKILNGEKTIEIRKTMPKCEYPIEVYIYCTKEKPYLHYGGGVYGIDDYKWIANNIPKSKRRYANTQDFNGLVFAKFTLNKVRVIGYPPVDLCEQDIEKSCLSAKELLDYSKEETIYGWCIDNLETFDRPKELSEFKVKGFERIKVMGSPYGDLDSVDYHYEKKPMLKPLTKAPQSWCYIGV